MYRDDLAAAHCRIAELENRVQQLLGGASAGVRDWSSMRGNPRLAGNSSRLKSQGMDVLAESKEAWKMGLKIVLLMILMFCIKSLILFAAWNYAFVDMVTILKPISMGQAFGAMFAWAALSFSLSLKE
ncbi:MAG: hypothetical protein ACWGQW_01510 [bacterium]